MAEAEYSTTAKLPVETIWDFVREMDNWAPMLTGYQSHEKENEHDSVWTLKGDVGVLARIVKFRVHVTEWAGPERVGFELEGLNEPMKGHGEFRMEPYEEDAGSRAVVAAESPEKGLWRRLVEAVFRFLYRLRHGSVSRGAGADAGPGVGMSRLHFRLTVEPGGPMAPMVNALMQPAMLPVAEELANKIMAHLEEREASG